MVEASCEIALIWMSLDFIDDQLTLVQVSWFRWWLGAIRQQTITWANVDLNLYRHMVSLGQNEFNVSENSQGFPIQVSPAPCNPCIEVCASLVIMSGVVSNT